MSTQEVADPGDEMVELQLDCGRIVGRRVDGVVSFLGLPYAAPTDGTGRLLPPQPRQRWAGVRRAMDYGPACPQPPIRENLVIDPEVEQAMFGLADEPQSEDCLSLNIWTPAVADGGLRPVLVSFHGGGFKSGSGSARSAPWFDGSRLARRGDAVVITVNHRIGVLGHLFVPGLAGSGNAGLFDLIAALEWIREHVTRFGGDPQRVTIFGESGGGGKVMALIAMPRAAGLFQRAICQSGSLKWLSREEAAEVTAAVLKRLQIDPSDSETALLPQLQTLSSEALVAAAAAATQAGARFAPVIDEESLVGDATQALNRGLGSDVPLIIGVTREEGAAFLPVGINPNWDAVASQFGPIAERYRKLHPDHGPKRAMIDLTTDLMFRLPALAAACAKAQSGGAPVFMYEFAWPTPVLDGALGAAHGVDVSLPFDNSDLHPATAGSESARELAPVVSDAWLSFARSGDPNHDRLPHWPPFDPGDARILIFDSTCRVQSRGLAKTTS